MPSPFPGMNPYLEEPVFWPGVHTNLAVAIQEVLVQRLPPHYYVTVELRVYESPPEDAAWADDLLRWHGLR